MNQPTWRPYQFDSEADAALIVLDNQVLKGGVANSIWCNSLDEWITINLDAYGMIAMIQLLSASRLLNVSALGFQPQFTLEYDPVQDRLTITLHPGIVPTHIKKCDARCEPVRILFAGDQLCGFEIHAASTAVKPSVIDSASAAPAP